MKKTGKIYIIGIGPGLKEHMSLKAIEAISESETIVGYKTYTDIINDLIKNKKIVSSGMRKEVGRCEEALRLAEEGDIVALISSGDSGIYGMAGLMFEVAHRENSTIEIDVVPGITSSTAAAAILGGPIMHDHATISLSDLLTDWDVIRERVLCAAKADFVICIYNPKSRTRTGQIVEARDIMLKYKAGSTPVGIVKNAKREREKTVITTLANMLDHDIDMTTVIIIGNSKTYVSGSTMITPRGYSI